MRSTKSRTWLILLSSWWSSTSLVASGSDWRSVTVASGDGSWRLLPLVYYCWFLWFESLTIFCRLSVIDWSFKDKLSEFGLLFFYFMGFFVYYTRLDTPYYDFGDSSSSLCLFSMSMTLWDNCSIEGITTCYISFYSLTSSTLALFCSSNRAIFSSNSLIRRACLMDDSTKLESMLWLSYFLIFIASNIDFSIGLLLSKKGFSSFGSSFCSSSTCSSTGVYLTTVFAGVSIIVSVSPSESLASSPDVVVSYCDSHSS